MNKNLFTNLILIIPIIGLLYYYQGCSSTDDAVTPSTNEILANGTLTPTNRTTVQGNLFASDQNGNPLQGLDASNVVARLRWDVKDGSGSDSVTGTVSLTQAIQKDIAGAFIMDYSPSMQQQQITCMQNGVKAFINRMDTFDLAEIVKFSNDVVVVQALTNNKTLLLQAADSIVDLGEGSSLYESMYQGLVDVKNLSFEEYVRAVLTFSDGGDSTSSVSKNEMIDVALEYGVPIYTVGLLSNPYSQESLDLKNIADTTGGFYFRVSPDTCIALITLYRRINSQLNNSYNLSITWPEPGLPPQGTIVRAIISINFNNFTIRFTKAYMLP